MDDLRNKRVTLAGLGHFGGQIAAARWLVRQGARVLVTDKAPAEKLADAMKELHGLPVEFRLGEHREGDFTSADLIVASPAIPPSNPYLAAARSAGVPVTTEIRLFVERCPATIVGVTATKGKSTTSAMLGRMLAARYTTHVGGNIGRPLLLELERIDKSHLVVLELSSYMLHYLGEIRWSPHLGLVGLIAPDHLEWHGGYEPYLDAKRNLLRFQRKDDIAVVNEESPEALEMAAHTPARVVRYGLEGRKLFALRIPGRHNQLNAQGAFAAANALGVTWEEAQTALGDFAGLPHRLQLVHEVRGVRYFNDSIATIPEAAVAALEAFPPKRVIQIVGGSDKGLPLDAMCAALAERAKAVFCIGAMGPKIAEMMTADAQTNATAIYRCGDLATAVTMAKGIAVDGDVVLLSPGCASYDQFVNFEARGDLFAKLARS